MGVKDFTFVVTAKMSSRTLVLFCAFRFLSKKKHEFENFKNCNVPSRIERRDDEEWCLLVLLGVAFF